MTGRLRGPAAVFSDAAVLSDAQARAAEAHLFDEAARQNRLNLVVQVKELILDGRTATVQNQDFHSRRFLSPKPVAGKKKEECPCIALAFLPPVPRTGRREREGVDVGADVLTAVVEAIPVHPLFGPPSPDST